ncbi:MULTISPECIES: hydroxypyruvate isomerase family protein [Paracoccus]|uniref:hydroxypyruvate isomerase family protein n=1 Tax=Paracoccus TaxID=265 RepID=UPI000CECC0B8|nr:MULTISPECIES: TIM barrel protein [Paracoccus]MDK8873830.1 TIM barrel protein [Paracoccus sp. SSJ]UFS68020.1 TIM barrel protein [Paracoccus denitrificans]
MTRFSANLGFLWADLPLPQAIRAAHRAGFDAVECHWPHEVPPEQVAAALAETGLPMLGLNTRRGRPGENGLAALPGREAEARDEIGRTLDYAAAIGCGAVHVMAGFAEGQAAERVFLANLDHACRLARPLGITILIEPLNRHDAPGYFLAGSDQAARIIEAAGHDNLRLMFDCYHMQIMEGDISRRLRAHLGILGHVQIASVPDRGTPDHGELDYRHVYAVLDDLGWTRPLGAEYRPEGPTEATLGWLQAQRSAARRQ